MLATSPDREFGDGHADEEQQDGRLGVGPASDVEPLVASWGTTTPSRPSCCSSSAWPSPNSRSGDVASMWPQVGGRATSAESTPPPRPWRRRLALGRDHGGVRSAGSVLSLRSCQFQHGVAGLGNPPRLQRNGHVVAVHRAWDVESDGLPRDRETKLLVESGGILQGRFLLTPDTRPPLEQRLVAVALVDQVGAALTESNPVPE